VSAIFLFRNVIFPTNSVGSGDIHIRELLSVQNITLPPCQLAIVLQPWEMVVGDTSAWVSAVLYLGARVPQIVLNYRRKTVEGLSISMFVLACVANTFYGVSILLQNPPINDRFYASVLAFLLGSLGTLFGSGVVIGQWIYYDIWLSSRMKSPQVQFNDEEEFISIKEANSKNVPQPNPLYM